MGAVACWKGTLPIVVSGSSDGTIKAWNTQTGALIATGEGHQRDAWALGVTNEPGARIVSGSFDRTVKVWDLGPVLRDLAWQRRRDFCMFLAMLGCLVTVRSASGAGAAESEEEPPQKGLGQWSAICNLQSDTFASDLPLPVRVVMCVIGRPMSSEEAVTHRVFCSPALYRTIATFL